MPVDRGAIDAQLREIGEGDRWWEYREFRELPHILHPEERIRGVARGRFLPSRLPRMRPGVRWLLVATDVRIICLKQGRLDRRQVDIPSGQILRARTSSRIRTLQLLLETPQRAYRIRIPKEDAYRFLRSVEPLLPQTTVGWLDGGTPAGAPPALAGVGGMLARLSSGAPHEAPSVDQVQRLEGSVERLQAEVERLQQQVAFLEDLLRKQTQGELLHGSGSGPAGR